MREARPFRSVLITGIGGSGGSYLAEYIADHHPEVQLSGIARWHSTTQDNLRNVASRAKVYEADLNDFGSVLAVLREVKPDGIFHIAAHANVRASFITPTAVMANNVLGTCNLFEAVRAAGLDPVIQLCSTSEVYGQVDAKDVPIREGAPIKPASPYAVSKTAQDLLGYSYFVSYKMRIIRTRMFAYLNPRRTDLFATSFARQVARIECGLQNELVHGNLDSVRTLIDVRDAMRAYWEALIYCEFGEAFNIGGNTSISVREFVERLVRMAKTPIPLRPDPSLFRPSDVTLQIPCVKKFQDATGWKPQYKFEESVEHLLNYWRERVRREASER